MRTLPLLLALPGLAHAQDTGTPTFVAPTFAPPVRIKAGDAFLGQKRLYPSPVFHDMNGDGLPDLVVGDLPGRLTVALRKAGAFAFGPEEPVKAVDGKPIDFHNW